MFRPNSCECASRADSEVSEISRWIVVGRDINLKNSRCFHVLVLRRFSIRNIFCLRGFVAAIMDSASA